MTVMLHSLSHPLVHSFPDARSTKCKARFCSGPTSATIPQPSRPLLPKNSLAEIHIQCSHQAAPWITMNWFWIAHWISFTTVECLGALFIRCNKGYVLILVHSKCLKSTYTKRSACALSNMPSHLQRQRQCQSKTLKMFYVQFCLFSGRVSLGVCKYRLCGHQLWVNVKYTPHTFSVFMTLSCSICPSLPLPLHIMHWMMFCFCYSPHTYGTRITFHMYC